MMKKLSLLLVAILLAASLSACGGDKESGETDAEKLQQEAEQLSEEAEAMGAQMESWPAEALSFGVPEPKNGRISSVGITDKAVAIGCSDMTRDDMEAYKELLLSEGFANGQEYPGMMWNYVKNSDNGAVDVTIAFDPDTGEASVIINPKDQPVEIENQAGTISEWPDAIPKDVPKFSKGTLLKSADNGLITMDYKDVKQGDVDAYKKALEDAGFTFDEADSSSSSSQYEKVDETKMSIVIVGVDYKDGYMTLSIVGM